MANSLPEVLGGCTQVSSLGLPCYHWDVTTKVLCDMVRKALESPEATKQPNCPKCNKEMRLDAPNWWYCVPCQTCWVGQPLP